MDASESRALLWEIADCPELRLCREHPDSSHPCQAIVDLQADRPWTDHQRPEPWNGDLVSAPVLFVSSNPSIDRTEPYPTGAWGDPGVVTDFFARRFEDHIVDGTRPLKLGNLVAAKPVQYLAEVKRIAANLFARPVEPGRDYAITEVVHCKSASRAGLDSKRGKPGALELCPSRYLRRVLEASGAKLIVVVGVDALRFTRREAGLPEDFGLLAKGCQPLLGPLRLGGGERHFLAVGGIGAADRRDVLSDLVIAPLDLARVRALLL